MINLVKIALRRPYTMAIAAMLIMLMGFISVTPHDRRHLPEHRHPGRLRRLELQRPQCRGHGAARRAGQRARLFDHGQRHRSHRVAVDPRPGHPQDLLPAGHRYRRRHRADLGAEQRGAAHRAAGHAAAEHHPVQRVERAGGAGHAQHQDAARADAVRLCQPVPAAAAVHDSRACRSRAPSAASSARSSSRSIPPRPAPRASRRWTSSTRWAQRT